MRRISLFLLMSIAAMTFTLVSCTIEDNPSVPITPVNPEPQKARYTVLVYGNAGGDMDNIIEHVYEECKPLMKSGEVRIAPGLPDTYVEKNIRLNGATPSSMPSTTPGNWPSPPTMWGYTFGEAYEFTNFAQNTGWGNWLKTNLLMPNIGDPDE